MLLANGTPLVPELPVKTLTAPVPEVVANIKSTPAPSGEPCCITGKYDCDAVTALPNIILLFVETVSAVPIFKTPVIVPPAKFNLASISA